MVFDEEFSTVSFMREGIIQINCTDIVQHGSQSGSPDNIGLKDTWLTSYIQEDRSDTLSHDPSVAPENNNNTLTSNEYQPERKQLPLK